jgi:hypothetical protein
VRETVRLHAIVALLRLARLQPPRRARPLVVMMLATIGAILWAPPIVGFGVALAAAGFWWFVVD